MKESRQVKIKRWKELTWEELADLGSLIQRYDGVMSRNEGSSDAR